MPTLCLLVLFAHPVSAVETLPTCLAVKEGNTIQATVKGASAEELLARLVYAESHSTGFPDDPLVYRGIAWGVVNRVRLGEASAGMRKRYGRGVAGVIFRKSQFNPAVSPRSPFSKDFLCPQNLARWQLAVESARQALQGRLNPFIQTPWEKRHGLSLVVNFYYPQSIQARGPVAPWEGSPELKFIGDVPMDEALLPARRIRFYRLARPPKDISEPAK
jgi:hypothetical protein